MAARAVLLRHVLVIAVLSGCVMSHGQRYHHFTSPTPLAAHQHLVLGFVGGRQKWDSETEGVRRLVLRLRAQGRRNIRVETV